MRTKFIVVIIVLVLVTFILSLRFSSAGEYGHYYDTFNVGFSSDLIYSAKFNYYAWLPLTSDIVEDRVIDGSVTYNGYLINYAVDPILSYTGFYTCYIEFHHDNGIVPVITMPCIFTFDNNGIVNGVLLVAVPKTSTFLHDIISLDYRFDVVNSDDSINLDNVYSWWNGTKSFFAIIWNKIFPQESHYIALLSGYTFQ